MCHPDSIFFRILTSMVSSGQKLMDTSSIVRYFRPLSEWLDKYFDEHDVPVGWDSDVDVETLIEKVPCHDVPSVEGQPIVRC